MSPDLVLVVDVRIGQLSRHQLKQHDAKGVDVRLERVWVVLLHADHLWGLNTHTHTHTHTCVYKVVTESKVNVGGYVIHVVREGSLMDSVM